MPHRAMIEIVTLAKRHGPLTKRISLDANGKLISDGSACVMGSGSAWRTELSDMTSVASHIAKLGPSEAIALGRLRHDLPAKVEIVTKAKLNGAQGAIARTGEFIAYAPGAHALLLIDVDTKGMPDSVRARVAASLVAGCAIASVVPDLGTCGCVVRPSTTTGVSRTDTGEALPGSEGRHIYILVCDGADAERALRALHDRLWLAGYGWMMIGAAGQLLDRSLADRMVYAPERLVFEAAPVLDPPLVQDLASRAPLAREGEPLDTATAIPDLTPVEQERLRALQATEADRLKPDCAKARATWIDARIKELIKQRDLLPDVARQTAERAVDGGVLLPDFVLLFDLPEFAGKTVGDVLADPDRFVGATLADPLEGVAYGTGKAKVMQRADGSLMIHSFAHGRATYELKYDAGALRALLAEATDEDVIERYVRLVRRTELADLVRTDIEHELADRLKSRLGGTGVQGLARHLKAAQARLAAEDRQRWKAERQRARIEAGDFRPQFEVPFDDAPLLPVTAQLDAVFTADAEAPEPPMRNLDGYLTMALARSVPGKHLLTSAGANAEEAPDDRLAAPEHVLLAKLTEIEAAKLVEDHIDYVTPNEGRSVRLPLVFVKAYHQERMGTPLPTITSVATMPVILPDGTMLSGHRLDRDRGILFRVPEELERLLPRFEDCTDDAVAEATHFLADEWLVDVPTDYTDKLKLLALGSTILQRSILPERPAFFITAGQRGNGKTTAITMVSVAILGERVSAAAWSTATEERRKALLALFGAGVPLICWDNIQRGSTISDPAIEKSLTMETYNDRVLGFTEFRVVPANSIMCFTGNNIGARGDMASRSLVMRLFATRVDPENRTFTHADPIAWTYNHRGKILRALYTIIMGNPHLRGMPNTPSQTRFKTWWDLIGSAFEYAAICHRDRFADKDTDCPPVAISFRDEFLANDAEDEQGNALAIVLKLLRGRWPNGCTAATVLSFTNNSYDRDAPAFSAEFFDALAAATGQIPPPNGYSTRSLTGRLKAVREAPTEVDGATMILRFTPHNDGGTFTVQEVR
jgi:hypothetical protein